MAPSETYRPTTPTLLQLSTTLLTVALACGLALLFILNLPLRKPDPATVEKATFKGDPLFVVQFPRFEAEPVGDSVRDVSQLRRQPIPDHLPPLNPPAQAPHKEHTPEFTAAEQMFEAFPGEDDQPTELQPEFEPEPAPVARRNPPRPATGHAAAMQPRGVVSAPKVPANRQQTRPQRWSPSATPDHTLPRPGRTFTMPETGFPEAALDSTAAPAAEIAAELRSMKEQLSQITRQLAAQQSAKAVATQQTPAAQPVPRTTAARPRQTQVMEEPVFNPIDSGDVASPGESAEPEFVPETEWESELAAEQSPGTAATEAAKKTESEPQPPAKPLPAPEPQPTPAEAPVPLPEPEPLPAPAQPEPTVPVPVPVPEPEPQVMPQMPQPAVQPDPVTPVPPPVPVEPASPAEPSARFVPPQPTEPVVRAVPPPSPTVSPDERIAGMSLVPPPSDEAIRAAVQPLSVRAGGVGLQERTRVASGAPPQYGGTMVRGSDKRGQQRSTAISHSVAGVRGSVISGKEESPRPGISAPAWFRNLLAGRKTSQRPTVAGPSGRSADGGRSAVAATAGGAAIFDQRPRSGVVRASATGSQELSEGAIRRAAHVSPVDESSSGGVQQSTQYRSLRDGHNKPGRLFDPHAWSSPAWLEDSVGQH